MKRFGEQSIKLNNDKDLPQKDPKNKPPELFDVGMKIVLKAHSFHAAGTDLLGSAALESATHHSLNIGVQNAIKVDMPDEGVVDVLNREQADFKRVEELIQKIKSGEIGGKKKRPIVAKGDVKH